MNCLPASRERVAPRDVRLFARERHGLSADASVSPPRCRARVLDSNAAVSRRARPNASSASSTASAARVSLKSLALQSIGAGISP